VRASLNHLSPLLRDGLTFPSLSMSYRCQYCGAALRRETSLKSGQCPNCGSRAGLPSPWLWSGTQPAKEKALQEALKQAEGEKLLLELADLTYRWRRNYFSMTRSEAINQELADLALQIVALAGKLVG
jgi:hypothetical protein